MMTTNKLLTLLIEECAEVIQAATKCQRFGFDRLEPGYGVNSEVLSQEIGDLAGVLDEIHTRGLLAMSSVATYRTTKMERAERAEAERTNGASMLTDREACAREIEAIAADWRADGQMLKVHAAEYLVSQILSKEAQ